MFAGLILEVNGPQPESNEEIDIDRKRNRGDAGQCSQ
jgi:hypothetical protein